MRITSHQSSQPTIMCYRDEMTFEQMEECELFDNIPYKEMKQTLKDLSEDDEIIVYIEDVDEESQGEWKKTQFTFELCIKEGYEREGNLSGRTEKVESVTKEYIVIKEYLPNSPLGIYVRENLYYETEDESEEEDDE